VALWLSYLWTDHMHLSAIQTSQILRISEYSNLLLLLHV
jgi:hypothetical protein